MSSTDIDKELANLELQIKAQEQQVTLAHEAKASGTTWWTTTNAMTMSSVILIFGLVVIGFATYLIRKNHAGESILRVFGTILIITIAVFLVVAGYDDKQIAPAMGLLGTIAGYLLGNDVRRRSDNAPDTAT